MGERWKRIELALDTAREWEGEGGEKIERQANSFLQFPQAEGIIYRQTLCLFTWPSWKQQEAMVWDARGLGVKRRNPRWF